MNHSGQLRVPRSLFELRKKRLTKLLALGDRCPDVVICAEAELFLHCFKWSWRAWFDSCRIRHLPWWLLYIVDADYRAACKATPEENEEFEGDLRGRLRLEVKAKETDGTRKPPGL